MKFNESSDFFATFLSPPALLLKNLGMSPASRGLTGEGGASTLTRRGEWGRSTRCYSHAQNASGAGVGGGGTGGITDALLVLHSNVGHEPQDSAATQVEGGLDLGTAAALVHAFELSAVRGDASEVAATDHDAGEVVAVGHGGLADGTILHHEEPRLRHVPDGALADQEVLTEDRVDRGANLEEDLVNPVGVRRGQRDGDVTVQEARGLHPEPKPGPHREVGDGAGTRSVRGALSVELPVGRVVAVVLVHLTDHAVLHELGAVPAGQGELTGPAQPPEVLLRLEERPLSRRTSSIRSSHRSIPGRRDGVQDGLGVGRVAGGGGADLVDQVLELVQETPQVGIRLQRRVSLSDALVGLEDLELQVVEHLLGIRELGSVHIHATLGLADLPAQVRSRISREVPKGASANDGHPERRVRVRGRVSQVAGQHHLEVPGIQVRESHVSAVRQTSEVEAHDRDRVQSILRLRDPPLGDPTLALVVLDHVVGSAHETRVHVGPQASLSEPLRKDRVGSLGVADLGPNVGHEVDHGRSGAVITTDELSRHQLEAVGSRLHQVDLRLKVARQEGEVELSPLDQLGLRPGDPRLGVTDRFPEEALSLPGPGQLGRVDVAALGSRGDHAGEVGQSSLPEGQLLLDLSDLGEDAVLAEAIGDGRGEAGSRLVDGSRRITGRRSGGRERKGSHVDRRLLVEDDLLVGVVAQADVEVVQGLAVPLVGVDRIDIDGELPLLVGVAVRRTETGLELAVERLLSHPLGQLGPVSDRDSSSRVDEEADVAIGVGRLIDGARTDDGRDGQKAQQVGAEAPPLAGVGVVGSGRHGLSSHHLRSSPCEL